MPKGKIVVFTGVSGSGKSSLVFDTIYNEAQRQLIETFSSFARRRLPKISRPNVEEIRNLSPAIVIDQKRMGTTMASTVGTATEIFTYMRLLFSRCGEPGLGSSDQFSFNLPQGMCPRCNGLGQEMGFDEERMVDRERSLAEGAVLHPDYKLGGYWSNQIMNCGFFDLDKKLKDFSPEELDRLLHMDATKFRNYHMGMEYNSVFEGVVTKLKRRYLNREEGSSAPTRLMVLRPCPECQGSRINERARAVRLNGKGIPELVFLEMPELLEWIDGLEGPIAEPIARRMRISVQYLIDIGVGYLSLHRPVATLSGGESQRVKMARQLDCDLTNLIYVLDEPSIGLHPKDITHMLSTLKSLNGKGNSLLVVEHDPAVIMSADHVVDIGPGAGSQGGEVLFSGPVDQLMRADTATARALRDGHAAPPRRREPKDFFEIEHASLHNLKDVSVRIPKGLFVCVTGVAGSGKSSLIHGVFCQDHPEAIVVDQGAIGRSSRSNPLTYIGVFDQVRKELAKATNAKPELFSFNSEGACPDCKGSGIVRVDMHFLDEVTMVCDKCEGRRYTPEVLSLLYKGKSIADILDMTVAEGIAFFEQKDTVRRLKVLESVGLGYLKMGQSLSTLSGGEAQRIKLALELQRSGNIYVMDEPTTGLHMADTQRLLGLIDQLVGGGNSVIVIEHNLDVIRNADWLIDLGPDGGSRGGEIITQGTPEEVARSERSYTARYLRDLLPGPGAVPAGQ